MKIHQQIIEAEEAEKKSPEQMIAVVEEAEQKFKALQAAFADLRKTTIKLSSLFRSEITAGHVHNLDTPEEYKILMGVENLKDMYGINKEMQEAARYFPEFKRRLKAYKK